MADEEGRASEPETPASPAVPAAASPTPLLDELESGPWPSFVTEMKRAGTKKEMARDLVRHLECSYRDKVGHWKHGGIVGVRGYGGGMISGRSSAINPARSPYSGPTCVSSCSRRRRASVGLAPPVEIARLTSPRRTTAGRMKLLWAGSSTALMRQPSWRASSQTAAFAGGSSVAAITRNAPERSPG